jgi:hypothetical protein
VKFCKVLLYKHTGNRSEAEEEMQPEEARQCMSDLGLTRENMECVLALLKDNKKEEAKHRLRILRCELMDELHTCQRKVDQLDWLIRETEK